MYCHAAYMILNFLLVSRMIQQQGRTREHVGPKAPGSLRLPDAVTGLAGLARCLDWNSWWRGSDLETVPCGWLYGCDPVVPK